ncbi:MAG: ornithine cyclodeaminase family protein [Alphaproteobacteria bacterium]
MADSLLFLSKADVDRAALPPGELIEVVERAFALRAKGRVLAKPKLGLYTEDGNFFFSLGACAPDLGYAITHASMGTPLDKARPGASHIASLEILIDARTAQPVAILDALWVATMIPAAVTAVVAKHMARKDAAVAGFIACGAQARANLATLRAVRPIRRVIAYNDRPEGAESFAREVRAEGLEAVVADEPRRAVAGSDIVVTSVPSARSLVPFLDPAWLAPGSFASMVDLARSWQPGLERLDRLVTDDRDQAASQANDGRLKLAGPYDTEIAELVSGTRPGRGSAGERIAFVHPGHAVGILAIAARLYERAKALGLGMRLPG